MKMRAAIALLAVALLAVVTVVGALGTDHFLRRPPTDHIVAGLGDGLEIELPISRMAEASDVVARGKPIARRGEVRDQPHNDPRLPDVHIQYRPLAIVQFEVVEYLKGSGEETIPILMKTLPYLDRSQAENDGVRRLLATSDQLLKDGQEYILFLDRPVNRDLWPDGYFAKGEQARWIVRESDVYRPMYPKTLAVDALKALVQQ